MPESLPRGSDKESSDGILKLFVTLLLAGLTILLLVRFPPPSDSPFSGMVAPVLNEGRKWRVGYYEGGPYQNYPIILKATVRGLMDLGWVTPASFPDSADPNDARQLWEWLSRPERSDFIQFVKDAFWCANWQTPLRNENRESVLKRLNQNKDIDLMLAMGTWAGQDLANNRHHVPTLVLSSSDPLKAGIVKSYEDSGFDHVHARVDPYFHTRQISLFHNLFKFKRLGVAYENTPAGKTYAGLAHIETVAEKTGFEIVRCYTADETPDLRAAEKSAERCFNELAPKIDAMYATTQAGVNKRNMPRLMAPLISYKIPSYSQEGATLVKYGFLLGMAKSDFRELGEFHAEIMAKVFNGAKPRDLSQVFEDPEKIAINLDTAKKIGYEVPESLMRIADKIYEKTEIDSDDGE